MADVEAPKESQTPSEPQTSVEATGEEDYSPEYTPVVQLKEVETVKSDAEEEIVWENKCKLYRFDDGNWKERGIGIAKILKHKKTRKQRFIMHEDKTFKLRSNHLIMPDTKLHQHGGNEKALVFSTIDFAEEKPREESLCIRFGTPEKTAEFRAKYEAAVEENSELMNAPTGTVAAALEAVEDEAVPEKEAEDKVEAEKEVEQLTEELKEKVNVKAEQ